MSSLGSPSDDPAGAAEEEIETLKAIYIKELEVTYDERSQSPIRVQLSLHPATADNADEQYVRLTLVIDIPLNYPNKLPEFVICNSRGLSDEDLQRIYEDLGQKARSCQGTPMLYELIELAKEHLTTGNTPRCSCAICLYGFCDEDAFIKTDCYHYFHSHCLRRYVDCSAEVVDGEDGSDKKCQVLCPVCREGMVYVRNELESPPPLLVYSESNDIFVPDAELLRLQRKMAALYVRQKSRGGIIDVEAEKNKFLLDISVVPNELDAVPKFKRAGSALSTEASNSSKPTTTEALKRSKKKSANGKPRWSRGTDSWYEGGRGSKPGNASASLDGENTSSGRGSEEFPARENRRAPRRGSQHGWSRRGRGSVHQNGASRDPVRPGESVNGFQSGRPNGSSSVSDCDPHVPDRTAARKLQTSRGDPSNFTLRANSLKCRASEQSCGNEDSRDCAPSSSSFRNSARNCEVNDNPVKDRQPSAVCDAVGQKSKRLVVTGPPSQSFGLSHSTTRRREDAQPISKACPPRFKSRTAVPSPRAS